ncbi:hypothetical protein GS429_04050 [Natronorubrum sp. JWXQ-INN-674]|uniref:Uncharacterized protein n=1 Tax=Natronorubrum halalkaliphilum TaxID=2691917 RepID=A0A6B0VJE7_9EURY|nr:hypothetical protein [Natronorubrum halalkaliphilum]MXV61247.1 hypothetical protein [Natronorubrum halalkaliphilum]
MRRGPGRDASQTTALTSPSARVAIGFVSLVGLSGGMIAVQGDAPPVVIAGTVLGGLIAGAALLWYVYWIV